jgi:acyl-CoA synthetase (AMP-forming)/AMP-acid ligase II
MLTGDMRSPSTTAAPALLELIARYAADRPDDLAFDVKGERITWHALQTNVRRAAARLSARGVEPGAPCVVALPTSPEFLSAFFGAQLVGAIPVALNPRLPSAQIVRRARALGASLLVLPSRVVEAIGIEGEAAVRTADAASLHTAEPTGLDALDRIQPDGFSHLQVTSGTTGESRAVVLRHPNVMAAVHGAMDVLDPSPRDVLVGWLPLYHDLGLVRFVFESIYFGTSSYLLEPAMTSLPSWLQTISRVGGTITAAPDFAYRVVGRLVDPETVDLRTLRTATNGGEVVRSASIRAFEERFRAPGVVQPGYGLAEATLAVTCSRPGDERRLDASGAVSCGRALKNIEVRIADAAGRPLAAGTRGRVLARGPAVTDGYWNDPAASAEILRDGWLDTGDEGALDAGGELYVLGRTRAMIKRAGATIAPREIEEIVDELAGVRRSAAVGVAPATALTEDVVVVVEIERTVTGEAAAALRAAIVSSVRTALGFAPSAVRLVAPGAIPRTATGKTRYDEVRNIASGRLCP